jgi:HK97 family phage portal protein
MMQTSALSRWTTRALATIGTKALSLAGYGVAGSRGWWPLIQELTTGGWQRNEDVPVDTALSNPTLFACVAMISGDIGKLTPKLIERDGDGVWSDTDSPAFSPFLRKPNPFQTWPEFQESWQLSKLNHGNAYVLKARDGRGVVVAGYVLDACRVFPLVAPDGSVFYQLVRDELAQVGDGVVVPAREIMHDRETTLFHPLCGVSPIYAAGYPAVQGLNIRRNSDKFFSNGSKPGGVLSSPLPISQATADRIKAYWDENFKGDNIGKIAVLGDGLKYEAMAMSAEQSQLVEQLRFSDEDIARAFTMPLEKVNLAPESSTSVESVQRRYHADCLQRRLRKTEACLTHGLELPNVPGRVLEVWFERDDLLEMDTLTRLDAATKLIAAGGSPNEARVRFLDLGRTAGGDTPFLQQQNWPIELLAKRDLADLAAPQPRAAAAATQDAPAPAEDTPPEDATKAALVTFRKVLAA